LAHGRSLGTARRPAAQLSFQRVGQARSVDASHAAVDAPDRMLDNIASERRRAAASIRHISDANLVERATAPSGTSAQPACPGILAPCPFWLAVGQQPRQRK